MCNIATGLDYSKTVQSFFFYYRTYWETFTKWRKCLHTEILKSNLSVDYVCNTEILCLTQELIEW